MTLKKLLLSAAAGLLFAASATAQVNTVPQNGLTFEYLRKTTYSAAFFNLVPAASATDIVCIGAAATNTKTIRLQTVKVTGTAATLVTTPVVILARNALDTGGTPAGTTANPANTIAKRIPTDPTATATLVSYTANPTINDASPTYVDAMHLTFGVSGTSVVNPIPAAFEFGLYNDVLLREPTIPAGTARQFCVNLTGVTVATGSLSGSITWTEE